MYRKLFVTWDKMLISKKSHTDTCVPVVFVLWLLVGSDVVHSLLGDDTDVDVVAWAEVVHDAWFNSSSHQLLRRLQLRETEIRWKEHRSILSVIKFSCCRCHFYTFCFSICWQKQPFCLHNDKPLNKWLGNFFYSYSPQLNYSIIDEGN